MCISSYFFMMIIKLQFTTNWNIITETDYIYIYTYSFIIWRLNINGYVKHWKISGNYFFVSCHKWLSQNKLDLILQQWKCMNDHWLCLKYYTLAWIAVATSRVLTQRDKGFLISLPMLYLISCHINNCFFTSLTALYNDKASWPVMVVWQMVGLPNK